MSISALIPLQELIITGDSAIITKYNHLNCHGHVLGTYIKDEFPCDKDTKNEDPELLYVCLCVELIHSTTFIFSLYLPQDKGSVISNQISDRIENILTKFKFDQLSRMQ